MTKTEYRAYLASDHWRDLRAAYLEENPTCAHCCLPRWLAEIAYDQDLHAHHTSYAHLGTDGEYDDLQTLCRRCHDIETFGRSDLHAPKHSVCSCGRTYWDRRASFCADCLLVLGLGDKGIGEYVLQSCPWNEEKKVWKEILWSIHYAVDCEEIREELARLDVLKEERERRRPPICDADIDAWEQRLANGAD